MFSRRELLVAAAGAAAAPVLPAFAQGQKVLRIAMTAADVPTTHGIPNNGFEGYRFLGYPPYDGLVNWDLRHNKDQPATIEPGLATAWKADDANPLRWVFRIRKGVTFHDGSEFNAAAVIWNLQRSYDDKAPQYDGQASPIVRAAVSMIASFEKADDETVVIHTKYPFGFLPWLMTRIMIASPTQWEKVGKSWAEFAKQPSGTGAFKITKVVPGQYVEMSRNESYWDKERIPRVDKMIVYPMAEATTRVAALRSGQVDWIEVPAPDAIPTLQSAGFQISLWPYPHTYPYLLRATPDSPFNDVRVRQAINYAVDREGVCKLVNGTAKPAIGLYQAEHPLFGTPANRYSYNPEKAKALLKDAGYGPGKPMKAKIMISTSGSGQMLPIPMNELMQQNFKAVGMDIDFDVVEWGAMLVGVRSAPTSQQSHGVDGINISLHFTDPGAMFRYYSSDSFAPNGFNWGQFSTPELDKKLRAAQATLDVDQQMKLLAEAHSIVVDEAAWLFIVHDLNPRAMSKKVLDFKPAQSWFQDFTQVSMG